MSRSVLVVDDSPTIRGFAKLFLRALKLEVQEAEDGRQALAAVRARPPDLVIADINMPGMDGITLTRELRTDVKPELRALPIILLTGDRSEELRQKGRDAGASDFLEKPLKGAELQSAVRRFLGEPSA